jgi:methyl-accepting chemotaxis protein
LENRRSLKSLFTRPSKQLFIFLSLFVLVTFAVCTKIVYLLIGMRDQVHDMGSRYQLPPELSQSLDHSLTTTAIITGVAGLVMTFAALSISATLSQRIFAPMIPIKRVLKKLQDGQYGTRGHLRKGDEFQDVMEEINTLAKKLEERHSSSI